MAGQMTPQELRDFITSAVNAVVQNLNLSSGPPGEQGSQGPPGNDGVGNKNGSPPQLKADDIGFFDPAFEGEGPIANSGRHTFYRDVYAFVDRLKDIATIKSSDKVREVLPTCFRGEALIWHSTELTDLEKTLLRTAPLEA